MTWNMPTLNNVENNLPAQAKFVFFSALPTDAAKEANLSSEAF